MTTGKLLSFHPSNIEFSSEWKRPFNLSMKLINNSDIGMSYQSADPDGLKPRVHDRNFTIRPFPCHLEPKSTTSVTVECKNPNPFLVGLSNFTNHDVLIELEPEKPEVSVVKPNNGIASAMSLIDFIVKWKKPITCSLQLSNKTENHVAFMFTTDRPEKYSVAPNSGIVPPKSTAEVTVTMELLENAPLNEKDKLLVQSFVATGQTTASDICVKMLNKKVGDKVEEAELRVVYLPPEGKVRKSFTSGFLKLKPWKLFSRLLKLKPSKLICA